MKNFMKNLLGITVGLLLAVNVWALPIDIGDHVIVDQGGLTTYNVTNVDLSDDWDYYSSFCVESGYYFEPGHEYIVLSVADYVEIDHDYLSDETRWLYATYMTDPGNYSATLAQNAVWWLEDESSGVESAWNSFFLQVTGLSDMTGYDFSTPDWDIQVVNLTDINGTNIQSQLVGSQVPEPATLLLFGLGLLSLASIKRK